jgi:hypothetical protein
MAATQTITTSQLPAGFEAYYKTGVAAKDSPTGAAIPGLIPQAFGLYGKGTPQEFAATYADPLKAAGLYGAERVAGLNPYQQQAGEALTQLQTPAQFQMATGALGSAYEAGTGLPSMIDPGALNQYMSPYMQNVVDVAKQRAIEDAQKSQLGANLGAAKQGTYGGARQLLAQTERERALGQGLAEIQAKGLQSAYEAAQKGLEAERTARLQQSQTLGTLGTQFGQVGGAQQTADIERIKGTAGYGDLLRALEQQQLDTRFADLMKAIEFPETQLERLSGFIRGIPMSDRSEVKYTPTPSLGSQITGLGLAALGAGGGNQKQQN